MAGILRRENFRFLYREDAGRISRSVWLVASAPLFAIFIALTSIWLAMRPRRSRDLSQEALFDPWTLATFAYLFAFVFVSLVLLAALYCLSAKRFHDRGKPGWLALIAPFAAFIAGAMRWMESVSGFGPPGWALWGLDAIAITAFFWTIIELGFKPSR